MTPIGVVGIRNVLCESGFRPVTTGIPQDIEHLVTAEDPDLVLLRAKPSWNGGLDLLERICRVSDAPVSMAPRNWATEVLLSSGNVRLSVLHKCHSVMLGWYQMLTQ